MFLAEDDLLSQNVTRKMLTTLGMNCTVVSNGKGAVNLLTSNGTQEAAFDVVLMDMLMPTMGGIKATQEIQKRGIRVPIIAMTANALGRDWEECRWGPRTGVLLLFLRPTRVSTLKSTVVCLHFVAVFGSLFPEYCIMHVRVQHCCR